MFFSNKEIKTVSQLIERIANCTQTGSIVCTDYSLSSILPPYIKRHLLQDSPITTMTDSVCREESEGIVISFGENISGNIKIILSENKREGFYPLVYGDSTKYVGLVGCGLQAPLDINTPKEFKVLAIIHTYNENDIISETINYLLQQGVDVYLVDNWSNDGTFDTIVELADGNCNRVYYERFPQEGPTECYEWYNQLQRTEQISSEMKYDWYIHYDADEYRITPWEKVTIRDFLFYVDSLGYNAVDNTVIDFRLTDISEEIYMQDTFFEFGKRKAHFEQRKTWKGGNVVDLKSSGGHIADFNNPKVFPLKILNRHYSLRSYEQAKRKILIDRKPRFEKEKKERGWHCHYDSFELADIIKNKDGLIEWKKTTTYDYFIQLFMGAGVDREGISIPHHGSLDRIKGKRVVVYGAGQYGQGLVEEIAGLCCITGWLDKNSGHLCNNLCMQIDEPKCIRKLEYDYILIAVKNENVTKDIVTMLVEEYGVDTRHILCPFA